MASRESYKHHFASLLVAVADVYDALRTIRPYRQALSVARASTILIQYALSGKLHREYVSAFLKLVGVLTPGRHVVLSDGTRGTIIEAMKDRTLTPMVEDEDGQLYDLSDPSAPGLVEVEEDVVRFDQEYRKAAWRNSGKVRWKPMRSTRLFRVPL
jgi:hypothetical protein